jgi:hypothetical protein
MPMTTHSSQVAAARQLLANALKDLDSSSFPCAARQAILAAAHAWAAYKQKEDVQSAGYREAWESLAQVLKVLPPTILKRTMQILADECPGPSAT